MSTECAKCSEIFTHSEDLLECCNCKNNLHFYCAGYVTPGKPMSEVRVLFMGRECFEALSHDDCQYIYDKHQRSIIEKAKHNFQVHD